MTEEMRQLAESLPPIEPSKAGYEALRTWLGRFYDIYAHYHPVIRAWTETNAQNPEMAHRCPGTPQVHRPARSAGP